MKKGLGLPFVHEDNNGRKDYWQTAQESGCWATDNRVGREYANALVEIIAADQIGLVLGFITEAMVRKGRFEGIEIGFYSRLGEIAGHAKPAAIRLARAA